MCCTRDCRSRRFSGSSACRMGTSPGPAQRIEACPSLRLSAGCATLDPPWISSSYGMANSPRQLGPIADQQSPFIRTRASLHRGGMVDSLAVAMGLGSRRERGISLSLGKCARRAARERMLFSAVVSMGLSRQRSTRLAYAKNLSDILLRVWKGGTCAVLCRLLDNR